MTIVWQSCNLTSVIWQPCRVIWHPRILKEKPHPVWQTEKRSCSRARVSKNVWRRSSARKKSFFLLFLFWPANILGKSAPFLSRLLKTLEEKGPLRLHVLSDQRVCAFVCVWESVCVCAPTSPPAGVLSLSYLAANADLEKQHWTHTHVHVVFSSHDQLVLRPKLFLQHLQDSRVGSTNSWVSLSKFCAKGKVHFPIKCIEVYVYFLSNQPSLLKKVCAWHACLWSSIRSKTIPKQNSHEIDSWGCQCWSCCCCIE